jgi:hypothetical protein
MSFSVEMGLPEMDELWNALIKNAEDGKIGKNEARLLKKLGHTIELLTQNPKHPGLHTHEIDALTKRYGMKVWQSYLENGKPQAGRVFWVYGPEREVITIIGLVPHPESSKSRGHDKVRLSRPSQRKR